jgi:hypothetical protein
MIPLPKYVKIKDNYCVGYFGKEDEVILALKKARPFIEQELPGIKVYICCLDEKKHLLEGEDNFFGQDELRHRLADMAYFRNLPDGGVKELLEESSIPFLPEIFEK